MHLHDLSRHLRALNTMKLFGFAIIFFSVTAAAAAAEDSTAPRVEEAAAGPRCALTESLDGALRFVESVLNSQVIITCFQKMLGCLQSVFGRANVNNVVMFVDMALQFVSEGAASGLNVIAVYVSDILRAIGVDDKLSIPHFTPDGVYFVAKWALMALIAYWLLCVVLQISIVLLRRVFWLLKKIFVVLLFARVISEPGMLPEVTAARVMTLVIFCAVLSVATKGFTADSAHLENRIKDLEGRIKAIERKKEE